MKWLWSPSVEYRSLNLEALLEMKFLGMDRHCVRVAWQKVNKYTRRRESIHGHDFQRHLTCNYSGGCAKVRVTCHVRFEKKDQLAAIFNIRETEQLAISENHSVQEENK